MRRLLILIAALGLIGVSVRSLGAFRVDNVHRHRAPFSLSGPQQWQQHEGHAPGSGRAVRLAMALDGAENPAAISDEQAYGHFLAAMASLQNVKGREAALKSAGLTTTDRLAFVAALGSLNAELRAIADQGKAGVTLGRLQAQKRISLVGARNRVQSALSPEGAASLHNYIEIQVKRRIRVFRDETTTTVAQELRK